MKKLKPHDYKLVYIAGKYTSETPEEHFNNQDIIRNKAKEVLAKGYVPVAPTLITDRWELDPRFSLVDWLSEYCFPLLARCDCMVIASEPSPGVTAEIEFAKNHNIPILKGV